MVYTQNDLSETVAEIDSVIRNENHKTPEEALTAIDRVIKCSRVASLAIEIGKIAWDRYSNDPKNEWTQLRALEFALGEINAVSHVRYLGAAKMLSSGRSRRDLRYIDSAVLAICNITVDDDPGSSSPQLKPSWIVKWGLKRHDTDLKP